MVVSTEIEPADFASQFEKISLLLNLGFNIKFDDGNVGLNVVGERVGSTGGGDGGLVAIVDGQPETQVDDPQCASLYPQKPHCEQQAPFAQVVCAEHNRR